MEKQNTKSESIFSPSIQLLRNTFAIIKEASGNLLLNVFFIICLTFILFFFFGAIFYLGMNFNIIQNNYLFTFRFAWQAFFYIATFILGVMAQILIIKSLFDTKAKFITILSSLKVYFANFLCLSILINLIFLVCSLPLYAGILLLALNNLILGVTSIILAIALNIIVSVCLLFSSYILIEKNQSCISAIKESYKLASKNFWQIIVRLFFLCVGLIIIFNIFTLISFWLPNIGAALSILLLIPVILFVFAYLFILYRNLKY